MAFWTYILRNPKGRFYIGHTANLGIRVGSHNRTDKISGKFTRKNGPWELVWSEEHLSRGDAASRERQIKSWKSAKLITERLLNTEK
jgi:putative endonuclease